jgi:hypothetical protein
VRHVDQVANQVVSAQRGRLTLLSASGDKARWRQVIETSNLRVGETFLAQEWRQVVLAQDITRLEGYLSASRAGRGRPLGSRQRAETWDAISTFAAELASRHRWTYETVCVEATHLPADRETKTYVRPGPCLSATTATLIPPPPVPASSPSCVG